MNVGPSLQKINELFEENMINDQITGISILTGTTDGLVYNLVVNNKRKYVLKFDRHDQVVLVEQFLNTYHLSTLLPKIIFTSLDKSHFIYSYINGSTHINRGIKKDWLTVLVNELLNKYKIYNSNSTWGRLEYPCNTWYEFNTISIEEARVNIGSTITMEDYYFIESLVDKLFKNTETGGIFLLHGDTGVHNFVFDQYSLVGVIDPSPMVGPIIYDFIYAFCSSPDDINIETLFTTFALLEQAHMDRSRLIEEVAIQLYCRVGICLRHHPQDLSEYLIAWQYWKGICKQLRDGIDFI
jgi:hypothetical protein